MRRTSVFVLSAVVLLGVVLGGGDRFAAAQDPDAAAHPAAGSWLVESDPGDADYSVRLLTLAADGTALFVSGHQTTGVGAWEPTGETTAAAAFTVVGDGPGYIVVRASLDIAADGGSFTGSFTDEIVLVDPTGGATSGEIGPGTLAGTRLAAEAPGTPVQSFAEFFAPPGGTPAATPAP